MKKQTLIKFYNREASEQEINEILDWIEKSPDNKRYFSEQKALYTASQITLDEIINTNNKTSIPTKKRINRLSIMFRIGIAAAICALFFTIGNLTNNNTNKDILNNKLIGEAQDAIHNIVQHELYTEKGVKGFLILPDSSKVWLNSDSRITYPENFSGETRNITLSGEAYFEVTKDSIHPMIVKTDRNFSIEVIGTSFNLKCYKNDNNIEATLYSGIIKANYNNTATLKNETLTLKPNESFIYNDRKSTSTPNNIKPFYYPEPEKLKAWKDGTLIFDETPMSEVIKMLERWHGTTFIITNQEIYNYKLSAEFKSESIIQILEIMKLIMPIDYTCSRNVVTLK